MPFQGELELRVDGELIRLLEQRPTTPPAMSQGRKAVLREGMKVEARFRGKERYYPGVIRRENRDGTFDVDYNDFSTYNALCS